MLLHGLSDASESSAQVPLGLVGGFEQRAWRGQTHGFVRTVHQLRRIEENAPVNVGAFDLGLVICGALPRLYGDTFESWLSVLGRIDGQALPYIRLLAHCLRLQPPATGLTHACIDAVSDLFEADKQLKVQTILQRAQQRSLESGGEWRLVFKLGRGGEQTRPWPDDDIELSDEEKLLLYAINAVEHRASTPAAVVREIASWAGQSDARCAIAALLLGHRLGTEWVDSVALLHEARFQTVGQAVNISSAERMRRFWSEEATFSVAEQALLDELTSERRSTRLDLA